MGEEGGGLLGAVGHGCYVLASEAWVADDDIRGHLSSGQPVLHLLLLLMLLTQLLCCHASRAPRQGHQGCRGVGWPVGHTACLQLYKAIPNLDLWTHNVICTMGYRDLGHIENDITVRSLIKVKFLPVYSCAVSKGHCNN